MLLIEDMAIVGPAAPSGEVGDHKTRGGVLGFLIPPGPVQGSPHCGPCCEVLFFLFLFPFLLAVCEELIDQPK